MYHIVSIAGNTLLFVLIVAAIIGILWFIVWMLCNIVRTIKNQGMWP